MDLRIWGTMGTEMGDTQDIEVGVVNASVAPRRK